jgi:hypothetical protein
VTQELGKFEGRKFIYKEPIIMPTGEVIKEIKFREAELESILEDLAALARGRQSIGPI